MRSVAVFFLIVSCVYAKTGNGILPVLEEKLENKFTEYAGGVTKWLESFNDEHLGNTELGRFLHYKAIKTKLAENTNEAGNESRSMKKMGMAMMPLIFHIGATSTWMLITTVLAAKSLAVGLMLLIFKIAVSSAKLAAFFTHLKGKHSDHHGHHEWAWTPHYEHQDHHLENHPEHHGTISHIPEWTNDIPHNLHEYKNNEIHDFKPEFNFKPHEFHEYKTIPEMPMLHGIHDMNGLHDMNGIHDMHGFSDGFHDFNHFEGAKKKIDTKDTKLARSGSISKRKGFKGKA